MLAADVRLARAELAGLRKELDDLLDDLLDDPRAQDDDLAEVPSTGDSPDRPAQPWSD